MCVCCVCQMHLQRSLYMYYNINKFIYLFSSMIIGLVDDERKQDHHVSMQSTRG